MAKKRSAAQASEPRKPKRNNQRMISVNAELHAMMTAWLAARGETFSGWILAKEQQAARQNAPAIRKLGIKIPDSVFTKE